MVTGNDGTSFRIDPRREKAFCYMTYTGCGISSLTLSGTRNRRCRIRSEHENSSTPNDKYTLENKEIVRVNDCERLGRAVLTTETRQIGNRNKSTRKNVRRKDEITVSNSNVNTETKPIRAYIRQRISGLTN